MPTVAAKPSPHPPQLGTPEQVWAPWLTRQTFVEDTPQRLAATGRHWVLAPHPDDDVLGLGGLLAAWATLGGDVRLVAVTDGGASHPGVGHWPEHALMATRRAESAAAWRRLGLGDDLQVHHLGLPDGQVALHVDMLALQLATLLAPGDSVWATWRLDGHPDHEATGRAAAVACAQQRCTLYEYPVWMWHWAGPADPRVPWQRMRRIRLPPALQARKAHAVQAHASQLAADSVGGLPVLPPTALARWLRDSDYLFAPQRC